MPFALVTIGLLMIVAGARNTHGQFGRMLSEDFTGPDNFLYWLAGIGAVGAVGYYEPARGFSRAMLVLLLVAMVLSNGGFFAKFRDAIANASPGSGASPAQAAASAPLSQFLEGLSQSPAEAVRRATQADRQNIDGAASFFGGGSDGAPR